MADLGHTFGGKIKARWKVLLTDSCHSGAITPEADVQTIKRSLLDLNTSLFSLTASRDRERSFESPDWGGGHGIFTYYVVRGMEGVADENGDGIVTADELAEYVRRNVREAPAGSRIRRRTGAVSTQHAACLHPVERRAERPPAQVRRAGLRNEHGRRGGLRQRRVGRRGEQGNPLRMPGLVPGPTRSRPSRWATSRTGRARRWSIPVRKRPSASRS